MGELATELQYFSCCKYLHTLERAHLETYWTHTHTSLNVKYWCLFVGTFILQSSVFSHWSYSTVPNDKRGKIIKIPVTHRPWTQIQICNFKAEVNGSKVKLSNSEFGCFSEMAAVFFFFLINIFFQSFSRWNGHHCAKGKLNVTNPQLLSDVLCFILLLWPQDGAQLTDMATH